MNIKLNSVVKNSIWQYYYQSSNVYSFGYFCYKKLNNDKNTGVFYTHN